MSLISMLQNGTKMPILGGCRNNRTNGTFGTSIAENGASASIQRKSGRKECIRFPRRCTILTGS